MRQGLTRIGMIAVLACCAWWLVQPARGVFSVINGEAFATHYRIRYAQGPNAEKLKARIDIELAKIDKLASTWREDSELMRYNRASDPEDFELSAGLAELLALAGEIETQTGGAFSVRPEGGAIDLSGIAKGYAVDRVVELLQTEFGIEHALVDIGGEVRAIGNGMGGAGWRVGLYQPTDAGGIEMPVVVLHNMSVATSGAYFKGDHIFDPATGKPVESDLFSASVIHERNAVADALATAVYVMGSERGMAWAKRNAVRVVLMLNDGTRLEYNPDDPG